MLIVSRSAGHAFGKCCLILTFMVAWTVFAFTAVTTQFDLAFLGPIAPARPLIYLSLISLMAYLARNWILDSGVSQHVLIGLQLIRPIGLVFVFEYYRGTLPGIFAHPAGWGDLLVGCVAAYVLWRFWQREIPTFWVLMVACLGLLDFASAFFFGFTSSATPIQLFSFEAPNKVIEYPLGLIPLFLVPYAVVAHILSLSQLARDRNADQAKTTV